jgi:hypothetical protein
VVVGYPCPLTAVEQWARARAGRSALAEGGFIDHYLTGVVYPAEYLALVQVLIGLLVVASWLGLVVRHRARTGRGGLTRP